MSPVKSLLFGWASSVLVGGVQAATVAQASSGLSVDPGVSTLVSNLGVIGVLVWYLWYDTTKSRPKMLADFAAELAATRTAFHAEQAALRADFTQELAAQRAAFQAEQAALRADHAQEMGEMRGMVASVIAHVRTFAHDVKDTANTAIVKATLAAQGEGK